MAILKNILYRIRRLFFTTKQQQEFLENLATLIADGASLNQSVELLGEINNGIARKVAEDLQDTISAGGRLATGMAHWFPYQVVEIVHVGEEGGTLSKSLQAAADSMARKSGAISAMLGIFAYPFTVLIMGCAVAIFLNHSILHDFAAIKPIADWPEQGQIMVELATFLQYWWWVMIAAFLLIGYGVNRLLNNYVGELRGIIDKMPVLSLYRVLTAAQFMESLGFLIENGMSFKKAIDLIKKNASPYLEAHLTIMQNQIGRGKEIGEVLDTGLINQSDILRLKVVARGKGLDNALQRQGKRAQVTGMGAILRTSRMAAGLLLALGAGMAAFMITALYGVGLSFGA